MGILNFCQDVNTSVVAFASIRKTAAKIKLGGCLIFEAMQTIVHFPIDSKLTRFYCVHVWLCLPYACNLRMVSICAEGLCRYVIV